MICICSSTRETYSPQLIPAGQTGTCYPVLCHSMSTLDKLDRFLKPDYPLKDGCPANWTWSKYDKSHEVKLQGRGLKTVHFHPNWSNGTAAVRGNTPLKHGRHYWEISLTKRIFGTSMMFGLCTKKSRMHVDSFINLLGEDNQSWGLSHKGLVWHKGKWRHYTKSFRENEATTIGLLLDCDQGTLTYYKDGACLGIAFTGLDKVDEDLYPVISSTAAKTEMTLGVTLRGFHDLQDRCRATIVASVKHVYDLDLLPLPRRVKDYLQEALVTTKPSVSCDIPSLLVENREEPMDIR